MTSQKYLAHFTSCLLKTKMVPRSNSVRAKLFRVLHNAVCWHRREIVECEYLLDLFGETSPFDNNEGRFRHVIKTASELIGRSPEIYEICQTINRLTQDAHAERIFELTLDALVERGAKIDADKRLLVLIKGALAEKETQDFLDSLSSKSEERKQLAEMVDKAVSEAAAEFREKFGLSAT